MQTLREREAHLRRDRTKGPVIMTAYKGALQYARLTAGGRAASRHQRGQPGRGRYKKSGPCCNPLAHRNHRRKERYQKRAQCRYGSCLWTSGSWRTGQREWEIPGEEIYCNAFT